MYMILRAGYDSINRIYAFYPGRSLTSVNLLVHLIDTNVMHQYPSSSNKISMCISHFQIEDWNNFTFCQDALNRHCSSRRRIKL